VAQQPPVGQGLLIHEVNRSHSTALYNRYDSSEQVIGPPQRLDNTQHSQQTDIHPPDWIRTHNLSRSAAADLHLTPRGHWDQLSNYHYCSEITTGYRIKSGLYTRRRYELLYRICIFMSHTKSLKLPGNYYYVMHIFHIRFYFSRCSLPVSPLP